MKVSADEDNTFHLPSIFAPDPYCMVMMHLQENTTPADLEIVDCFPMSGLKGERFTNVADLPDDLLFAAHCISVGRTGMPFEQEVNYRMHGNMQICFIRIHLLGECIVVTTEDITETKQKATQLIHAEDELALLAAEKYAQIIQQIPLAFCIVEVVFDENHEAIDYIFLETNAAFAKQTILENPVGKSIIELQPDHEKEWCLHYGDVVKTRKPTHFIANARHIGNYVYEVWAIPLSPKTGNQVVIFFNDITETVNNEMILQDNAHKYRDFIRSLGYELPA